jgi:parvulin-like peptidyl-prolyl isomerase
VVKFYFLWRKDPFVKSLFRHSTAVLILLSLPWIHAQTPKPKSPPARTEAQPAPAGAAQEEVIPPAAPDALFPAVVARVNGKAILGRDLEQRIGGQLAPIGNPEWKNLRQEYRDELISQSLGSLIATELLSQKAVASGIKVTDAEVQAEFAKIAKTYPSDAEMNASLARQGLDRPALMKDLLKTLTVTKYIQEQISKKIVVTPAETSEYYSSHTEEFRHEDLVRTSHIFIMVPEGSTAEQTRLSGQRAESLRARAVKGEDFAKLAKENSMDGAASSGGDIGLIAKGQLAPDYENAAFALPVGGISDVIGTSFGFYVIKVTEKKPAGLSTLEEVKEQLATFLKDRKTDEELERTVNELRAQAKVSILIPLAGGRAGQSTASSPRP